MFKNLAGRGKLCAALGLVLFMKPAWLSGATLGDRLLIEMNDVHYTQRQMESYLLVKHLLQVNEAGQIPTTAAGNWSESLQEFRRDMLIEQETQRLGGFQPTEPMIAAAKTVIEKKLQISADLRSRAQALGLDETAMTRSLAAVLRIESFRRSREKQSAPTSKRAIPSPSRSLWLEELDRRAMLRYYDGAQQYVAIQPAAGG